MNFLVTIFFVCRNCDLILTFQGNVINSQFKWFSLRLPAYFRFTAEIRRWLDIFIVTLATEGLIFFKRSLIDYFRMSIILQISLFSEISYKRLFYVLFCNFHVILTANNFETLNFFWIKKKLFKNVSECTFLMYEC